MSVLDDQKGDLLFFMVHLFCVKRKKTTKFMVKFLMATRVGLVRLQNDLWWCKRVCSLAVTSVNTLLLTLWARSLVSSLSD